MGFEDDFIDKVLPDTTKILKEFADKMVEKTNAFYKQPIYRKKFRMFGNGNSVQNYEKCKAIRVAKIYSPKFFSYYLTADGKFCDYFYKDIFNWSEYLEQAPDAPQKRLVIDINFKTFDMVAKNIIKSWTQNTETNITPENFLKDIKYALSRILYEHTIRNEATLMAKPNNITYPKYKI